MPRVRFQSVVMLTLVLGVAALMAGCGVNPVTGRNEIQFVSESEELQIGAKNYAPSRQSEGGDLTVVPELTAYVNEVGRRLAAVSDRKLPYEFTVLNNSVPNAWALPGGKIAVNRGLLTELHSEAELAAVLGHEIVHAAARHGAKAQERGTLLQAGMAVAQVGAAVGGVDSQVAGVLLGGAGIGSQMMQMRYGRDQELEADEYGMKYMKRAGYDPLAAVSLQETFVRLSEGRQEGWVQGLFASHPPSRERVERNRRTAASLGPGGEQGAERFASRVAPLLKLKPAYDKYDEAVAALNKKDYATARRLASEAARLAPQEGRFAQLQGDIELNDKKPREALPYYEKAQLVNPGYFGAYLGAGIAQYRLGNRPQAEEALRHSATLLPTAPAALYLGNVARDRGDTQAALSLYQSAAQSPDSFAQEAAVEAARLELKGNPNAYFAAAVQIDAFNRPVVVIQNRSRVPMTDIRATLVVVNDQGEIVESGQTLAVRETIAGGQSAVLDVGLASLSAEQLRRLRVRIDSARVAP
jgi:beta-barrel assembly-enhancing protease